MRKVKKSANKNKKITTILAVMSVLLVVNIIAIAYIMVQLNNYNKVTSEIKDDMYTTLEEMNKVVLENDNSWRDVLFNRTTLSFAIPEDWEVIHSHMEYCQYDSFCDDEKYEITFNVGKETTFDEFADRLYGIIKELDEMNIVQSFKDDGYYEIDSFDEATYGNMYFDEKADEYGSSARHKVKLNYDISSNKVVLQVDVY